MEDSFTLSAWIYGGTRRRHHRTRDHFGPESGHYVILNERIGPFEEGTPIHFVIEGLLARLTSIESFDKHRGSFTVDSIILGPGYTAGTAPGTMRSVFTLDSLLFGSPTESWTFDALLVKGGSFSLDSWIGGAGRFTLSAFIV
jgi:hypothetical protein